MRNESSQLEIGLCRDDVWYDYLRSEGAMEG